MDMPAIERIGVSLEKTLLGGFDRLIARRGYQSRSEAIRDLIRAQLSQERLANPLADSLAAVCLLYDHHRAGLTEKLIRLQHSHLLQIISSMHVHISHHDCLEVIIMRGPVGEIERVADNIIALKGVKLGKVTFIPVEEEDSSAHQHRPHN
jgi:CopG family nickel-responsive transcriptional regulator